MKTGTLARMMMISSMVLCSVFVLSSCDKDDDNNNNNTTMYTVNGNASGTQMVPSVTGTGSATITGTYDRNTRVMTYTSNWTNLTGAPTSASFYSGASGVAGATVGSPWTLGTGLTGTGSFSGSTTLTADQETQLLNNGWYYTYSTVTNPGGEVRGQITTTLQ
jgi:hypothetical protein